MVPAASVAAGASCPCQLADTQSLELAEASEPEQHLSSNELAKPPMGSEGFLGARGGRKQACHALPASSPPGQVHGRKQSAVANAHEIAGNYQEQAETACTPQRENPLRRERVWDKTQTMRKETNSEGRHQNTLTGTSKASYAAGTFKVMVTNKQDGEITRSLSKHYATLKREVVQKCEG
ncbi:hypothetical protein NDU88_004285 [Pleurodeles waltl]|uniref:Uncharacterized protein n=1 Tax=Pleurodeles waltl TaxID=8319 RepID=A0AAV7QE16_PLEWA|nr:hypothetical protein NDU88_004285 [Pleurodeles waltl]